MCITVYLSDIPNGRAITIIDLAFQLKLSQASISDRCTQNLNWFSILLHIFLMMSMIYRKTIFWLFFIGNFGTELHRNSIFKGLNY